MTSETRQTLLLARTFFSKIFESDLMPPGVTQVRVLVSVLAFLAAPSLVLPLLLMKKYVWLYTVEELRLAMAQDRTMALLLSMTATAFITFLVWENIFPDRRDSRTLGVLPIRRRSFVLARLSAVVTLFSLLFLLTTALSAISFGILSAQTRLPEGFMTVTLAHFLSLAAAEAFIFFGILTVQCALLSVAGPTAAHRLAVVLQIGLIVTVLQMPMVLPPREGFLMQDGTPAWAGSVSASLLAPLWFVSLYQSLVGQAYNGTAHFSLAAGLLGTLTPLLALAFYGASYGRLTRLAIEGRPGPRRAQASLVHRLVGTTAGALTSVPAGAAVCAFTLRSLVRSRQHRMLLAAWIGVALALTISGALPLIVRHGWAAFEVPRGPLLVGPLIFAALIQTGMRSLFAIPVEITANWAFRLGEPLRLSQALAGASAALIVCGVVPPVVLAFASASWLWGIPVGIRHAVFCGTLAVLLVQILMRGIDKIPFTCRYTPGAASIGRLWPFYLTGFSIFTYGMARREAELLHQPQRFLIVVSLLGACAAVLWWLRLRRTRELASLRFEEEPELTLVSL